MALFRWLALSLAVAASAPLSAQRFSPDEEAARRHFEVGVAHYEAGRYAEALVEFEQARQLQPSAALDFNIGRVQERLEHWRQAADAFERYLTATPTAPEDVRARIAVLRTRARDATRPRPIYKRWWLWTTLGVVLAGGVAAGLAVGLTPRDAPRPSTSYFVHFGQP